MASAADTIVGLAFALGGDENIQAVENCLSRLRLHIKEPVPAEDKEFLALGAMGIIRTGSQIHLIYGTDSVVLKDTFENFLAACREPLAQRILNAAGGADNIREISEDALGFQARLKRPIPDTSLEGLSLSCTNLTLRLDPSPLPLSLFQYTLLFWDFLTAARLFKAFAPLGIQAVSACRTRLKLRLVSSPPSLPSGLGLLSMQEGSREVHMACGSRAEPAAALLKRFISLHEKRGK